MLNRMLLPGVVVAAFAVSGAHAQVTLDMSKITCEQYVLFKVGDPANIASWLSGYYNGRRNNMVIDVGQLTANAEKLMRYCEANNKVTVVDAVEKLFAPVK
jgi:acid stress chaperone HdeB